MMFRWGVAQELVPPSTTDAFKYVAALRCGQTEAPESAVRKDVPDEVVDATLPHLVPTVAAMVQVQRWAVMRPNEVCRMQVGDIDQWVKEFYSTSCQFSFRVNFQLCKFQFFHFCVSSYFQRV